MPAWSQSQSGPAGGTNVFCGGVNSLMARLRFFYMHAALTVIMATFINLTHLITLRV